MYGWELNIRLKPNVTTEFRNKMKKPGLGYPTRGEKKRQREREKRY